jgi:DNA-binding HxlR family transcriptional regulator
MQAEVNTRPDPDAVRRALDICADRWTFLILRETFFGVRRYGFFQRNLGIGRNVLADRLSKLVEHGILKRVRYRTDPDWYEYRLTRAGFELFPVIVALKAWSEAHLLDVADPRLDIHHCACGAELTPVILCECCGAPISADGVEYEADTSCALESERPTREPPSRRRLSDGPLLKTAGSPVRRPGAG